MKCKPQVKIFLLNFNVSISADNVIWGKTDRIQARKIIGNQTFWLPLLPYPASIYNVIWVMFYHKFVHSSDIFWRFHMAIFFRNTFGQCFSQPKSFPNLIFLPNRYKYFTPGTQSFNPTHDVFEHLLGGDRNILVSIVAVLLEKKAQNAKIQIKI